MNNRKNVFNKRLYLPLLAVVAFLVIFKFSTVVSLADEAGSGTETDPFTTEEATIQAMRNHLKAGKGEDITVWFTQEVYDSVISDHGISNVENYLTNQVFTHTGKCDEGDYLNQNIYSYRRIFATKTIEGKTIHGAGFEEIVYCSTGTTSASAEAHVTATNAALDAAMASLNLTDGMSEYQKVKAIYDYVRMNVTYDHDALDEGKSMSEKMPAHSTYNAAVVGQAVCQGYSSMLYNMMLRAGIDCRVITGTANGGSHAWNIVKIGSAYYNVDVTFDSDNGTDTYFLRKSGDSFPDHTRKTEYNTTEFNAAYPMAPADYDRPNEGITLKGCAVGAGGSILVYYDFALPDALQVPATKVTFTFPNDASGLYYQEMGFNDAQARGHVEDVGEGKGDTRYEGGKYIYYGPGQGNYKFVIECYRFTCAVPASRLVDSVSAKVVNGTTESEIYPISVKKFADVIIENPSGRGATEAQANFLKALLNYGAYSQLYFNYNTDKLANAAWGDSTPASVDTSAYGFVKPTNDIGITYYGASLLFKSDTIERHYFNLGNYTSVADLKNDFTFTIDGVAVEPVIKDSWFYIQKEGISAKDLYQAYTVTVTNKNTGKEITFDYGALHYVKQVLDKPYNADTKGLMRAIYDYSAKAEALNAD